MNSKGIYRTILTASALTAAVAAVAVPGQGKGKTQGKSKPVKGGQTASVTPKEANKFVTVDEFRSKGLPPKVPVSVEGYIVVGSAAGPGLTLYLTDSVDQVLKADDATKLAVRSAVALLPSSSLSKPTLAWNAKGIQKYVLYTGRGAQAGTMLHDTVVKVRVTGLTAGGANIKPVMKVEATDENGNFKPL